MQILVTPILNLILLFYKIFFNNLGWAIVAITVFINLALLPLTRQSLEMARKQQELKPRLDELRKKYGKDKAKLAEEQTRLFRQVGINPAAGCLPTIVQLVLIIALINAFAGILSGNSEVVARLNSVAYTSFLKIDPAVGFNTRFLVFDLATRDIIKLPVRVTLPMLNVGFSEVPGILVLLAALVQFLSAKMMVPAIRGQQTAAQETPASMDDAAAVMQKQMIYMFPILYLWLGTKYASGLALYFLTTSLFSLLRQWVSSGRLKVVVKK